MKTFKYFSIMLAMLACCVNLVSCGDDDDDDLPTLNDYYVEFSASGGGLDERELANFVARENAVLTNYGWKKIDKSEAIYEFDNLVKILKQSFNEDAVDGDYSYLTAPLKMTFYLKTTSGNVVKTITMTLTRNGCE